LHYFNEFWKQAFAASHAGSKVNVLVRPLARSLFRVMPLSPGAVPKLSLGFPFEFVLNRVRELGESHLFQFTPTSAASHDVIVTQLSGTEGVEFLVVAPKNASDEHSSRVWKSFGDEEASSYNDNGVVSFVPLDEELNKVFDVVVWLTPGTNVSSSVLVVTDTGSSDTPTELLNGSPTNSNVDYQGEKYFVVQLQPGLAKDVTININALTGDPDIYVNPGSRGFYHRGSIYTDTPDPAAAWSSTMPSGLADSLVISHSDDLFSSANGKNCSCFVFN
jgi:hypothetical protein